MRLITTRPELDALPDDSPIWGKSIDLNQAGAPYRKISGEWWDFGNEYFVGSDDINLPAVLIEYSDYDQK